MRQRLPLALPPIIRRRTKVSGLDLVNPAVNEFYQKQIIPIITCCQGVQGQATCPICGGVVNYTYSKFEGFTTYECSKNDCLPWPVGGGKKV